MSTIAPKKVYVSVILHVMNNGLIRPISIYYKDGKTYIIDDILKIEKDCVSSAGGCGTKYSIIVNGKKTNLYNEDGKWFVEGKE